MKIEVNIEKRYAIGVIMGLLILAGAIFAVAQWSQPDAWHDASAVRVNVDGEKDLQTAIDNDFCRGDGVNCPAGSTGYNHTWATVSRSKEFYQDDYLDYTVLGIPADANEILVHVSGWVQGNENGGRDMHELDIYTQEGAVEFVKKFDLLITTSNFEYGSASDNFWLPITTDNRVYVRGMRISGGDDRVFMEIIGYR